MPDKAWKVEERRIAKMLGVSRNPNIGRSHADINCGPWVIEVKKRKAGLPKWLKDALRQAASNATPGTVPLVIVSEVRQGVPAKRTVLVDFKDFREWYGPGGWHGPSKGTSFIPKD